MSQPLLTDSSLEIERLKHTVGQMFRYHWEKNVVKSEESLSSGETDEKEIFFRDKHAAFVQQPYKSPLDPALCQLDASRTWIIYWTLHSLDLLRVPEDQRAGDPRIIVDFLRRCRHDGGFGGGPSQMAHMATTYAAIASIAILNTDEAFKLIDRQALHDFFMKMKTKNGAFQLSEDGEIDMRGIYCVICCAHLTGILDDDLKEGVAEYIASCQRHDGGIGGNQSSESHAGYTYCGLAAVILLGKHEALQLYSLADWLSTRQHVQEGGFTGRPNKLVDSCYSFWVGASFALLSSVLPRNEVSKVTWYGSHRLKAYVLICCQPACLGWDGSKVVPPSDNTPGGFCDQPGNAVDFYHTCYALSGLSLSEEWCGETDQRYSMQLEQTCPLTNICYSRYSAYMTMLKERTKFDKMPLRLGQGFDLVEAGRRAVAGQ